MTGRLATISKRIRALSLSEWVALFQALVAIPLVVLALRLKGLRTTQRGLARIAPLKPPARADLIAARQYARIVTIAGNYGLLRPNCLQRSLVLWAILRRRHIVSQLRIGVAPPRGAESMAFHAWLEMAGEVINDRSDVTTTYQPFEGAIDAVPSVFDR